MLITLTSVELIIIGIVVFIFMVSFMLRSLANQYRFKRH